MLKNTPVNDEKIEESFIATILNDSKALDKLDIDLQSDDFYYAHSRNIYMSAISVYRKKESVGPRQILEESERLGLKIERDDLIAIYGSYVSSATLNIEAKYIKKMSALRKLAEILQDNIGESYNKLSDPEEIINDVSKRITAIDIDDKGEGYHHARESLYRVYQKMKSGKGQVIEYIRTGIQDLDKEIGGMPVGEITIIGARPAVGKTGLGMQIGMTASQYNGVAMLSLEMKVDHIIMRALSNRSGVDLSRLNSDNLNPIELSKIDDAKKDLECRNFFIDDTPGQTMRKISKHIRKLKRDEDIKLMVVDYLQYIRSTEKMSTYDRVTENSRMLKELAKELNIAILVLCQLSRDGERDKEPEMHHLKESGAIEQDAATILLMKEHKDRENIITVYIRKNRHGKCGKVSLLFMKNICKFVMLGPSERNYSND